MRPEQIPYGVKDFRRIRLEGRYYVDKTAYVRKLEARANFLSFVRPRRFGKSLLCETLRCYYDVAEKANFERLFGGLDIGKAPTGQQGRYIVVTLDFSHVNVCRGRTWADKFEAYMGSALWRVIEVHRAQLAARVDVDALLRAPGAEAKYSRLFEDFRGAGSFAGTAEPHLRTVKAWYDSYCFSPEAGVAGGEVPMVANPTLVLYYMQYFLRNRHPQPQLVDRNLRTDYMKIRHVVTEGRKVNGNYHRLEDVIARLGATATLKDSFQARELGEPDSFVSFLFYNGLVTVAGERMGRTRLAVPNLTVGEFLHDFVPRAYADVYGIDARLYDVADGMADFAETGDWRKALVSACEVVSRYWRVRDAAEGERVVQTALCSLLYVGHGPYLVRHEQESAGGFVDIAFEPQLARWPQIGHAALVELKYLRLSDDASPAALAKLKADAAAQLDRYAKDHDLARAWRLREAGGTVALHRIAIVFHGGDVACCEEI